jgi:hypothetical protein
MGKEESIQFDFQEAIQPEVAFLGSSDYLFMVITLCVHLCVCVCVVCVCKREEERGGERERE